VSHANLTGDVSLDVATPRGAAPGMNTALQGYNVERKCAENDNKRHNKFIFLTAISILVISSRNSFRVLFDKIVSVYFI